jgi:ADP-heptose:LPS heptosyltransferase
VLSIKRKLNSAVWRLKQAAIGGYNAALKAVVDTLTEKYWLLDYLPTFAKRKEGVLLVRLDLIGDFVLWLDSAQAYRQLYPNKKITLAVNSACGELAKALPHWDEVISVNVHRLRTDFVYRLRTLIELRWHNFAIAIQPTFSREFVGDLAIRSTNAPKRIGYCGDTNNILVAQKVKTDTWYSKLNINDPSCTMELSINAHFVRELGCIDFLCNVPVIPKITGIETDFRPTKPYVVIAPGASWRPKMWPIDHFAHLIEKLNSQFDIHFVLCGGTDDDVLCKTLLQKVNLNNVTNLANKTNLLELVEIIRTAALVITNDSSPAHIAAATATHSVCILGGGHFGRFLPYSTEHLSNPTISIKAIWHDMDCFGCSWRCKFTLEGDQAVPCISEISVDLVVNRCQALLTQILDTVMSP